MRKKKKKKKSSEAFYKITKARVLVFIIAILILFSDKLFTTYCTNTFSSWCYSSLFIGPLYQAVSVLLIEKTVLYYIISLLAIYLVICLFDYLYKRLKLNYKKKLLILILVLVLFSFIIFFRPINLNKYEFYDTTGEIKLNALFYTKGTNIFKENISSDSNVIMYGNYDVTIRDLIFEKNYIIKGNKLNIDKVGYLLPGKTQLILSKEEFEYISNYFLDFQKYFFELPVQYYLYKKNHVVSLGDIILLQCEKEAFERNSRLPVYFIPNENVYEEGYIEEDCYKSIIINNKQPTNLEILDIEYQAEDFNSKKTTTKISFTIDVESGRYLNEGNKGEHSINQCEAEIYSFGLEEHEKICDNADILPEFSNYIGEIEQYPWITGIKGFNEILDTSLEYGTPTTNFIVIRDLKVFEQLDPMIIRKIETLIEKDLIEIGVHTYYHRRLGGDILDDKEDLKKSKKYFEQRFGIVIDGMRSPYFAHVENDRIKHAEVLKKLDYAYFSHFGGFEDLDGVSSLGQNFFLSQGLDNLKNFIKENPYVLTISHSWDIGYYGEEKEGEIYLKQDDEELAYFRKAILLSLNEGAIFVKTKELVKEIKNLN